MDIELVITLRAEPDRHLDRDYLRQSVREAVRNALEQAEDMGFTHALAGETSIRVMDVDYKEEDR